MKNFVFISPNFPVNYWQFCRALRQQGLRVLGVGDAPRESFSAELQAALDDYRQVSDLSSIGELTDALEGYRQQYGRLDWIESNNEYWLEQDAKLRAAFGVKSGFQPEELPLLRRKSLMKEIYRQAGIPAPRSHVAGNFKDCAAFAAEVGYPVVIKPDDGHGITDACKLKNDEELAAFLDQCDPHIPWLMEEFVRGEVYSYDAVIDGEGRPVFETGLVTPMSIIDIVSNNDNAIYYVVDQLADDVRAAGRAVAAGFGIRSRFVHFEFFRLTRNHPVLGEAGQIVALEAGMCPCGGYALDMMNYARSTDVYRIWAEMIAGAETLQEEKSREETASSSFCAYVGRKAGRRFLIGHDRLTARYGPRLKLAEQHVSGDGTGQRYIGLFDSRRDMDAFYTEALWCE